MTHCVYYAWFDQDKTMYIGRTNDLERRKLEHLNDPRSAVYQYARRTGETPKFEVLEHSLSQHEAEASERSWVNAWKGRGFTVINIL